MTSTSSAISARPNGAASALPRRLRSSNQIGRRADGPSCSTAATRRPVKNTELLRRKHPGGRTGQVFALVFRLGWPIGLTWHPRSASSAQASVNDGLGPDAGQPPAHGKNRRLQIASATFMVHLGLSQAATVRTGRACGGRDLGRCATWRSPVDRASRMGFCGGCLAPVGRSFSRIPRASRGPLPFGPSQTRCGRPLLAAGTLLLAYAASGSALRCGGRCWRWGFLRGVQDTRVPMVIGPRIELLGHRGGRRLYALGFPLGLGGPGIWLGG